MTPSSAACTAPKVHVAIGPIHWTASPNLHKYAQYAVGLYRVTAKSSGCTSTALVKVGGRGPLTTVAGIVSAVVLVIGSATLIRSMLGDRRWVAGPLAGVVGAVGVLGLLQEFSAAYPTVGTSAVTITLCIVAGLVLPWAATALRRRSPAPARPASGPALVEPPPPPPPAPPTPVEVHVSTADWRSTHVVGAGGARAYASAGGPPSGDRLDAGLDVQVIERDDLRARVLCSNGWSCWVDGPSLVPLGASVSSAQ